MDTPRGHVAYPDITLGILAGGRAARLGGIDKAWLQRDGVPQVVRLRDSLDSQVATTVVSANRNLPRYAQCQLRTVIDRSTDSGPLAGVDAMLADCATHWLLTLPVDVISLPPDLMERFVADGQGGFAQDDDGLQPLVALWPVAGSRLEVEKALACGAFAVHELQSRLGMLPRRFQGFSFGNLNTPDDLDEAGITPEIQPDNGACLSHA